MAITAKLNVTIRRCSGNRDCWAAVCGPNEFLMATSYRLDALILLVIERHGRQKIKLVSAP